MKISITVMGQVMERGQEGGGREEKGEGIRVGVRVRVEDEGTERERITGMGLKNRRYCLFGS